MKDLNNKKVKINVDQILERGKYGEKYLKFISENKDKVFTAKLDVDNCYTIMYILEEDDSYPKWLFWENDLEVIS